jgi:hypothetical protein
MATISVILENGQILNGEAVKEPDRRAHENRVDTESAAGHQRLPTAEAVSLGAQGSD